MSFLMCCTVQKTSGPEDQLSPTSGDGKPTDAKKKKKKATPEPQQPSVDEIAPEKEAEAAKEQSPGQQPKKVGDVPKKQKVEELPSNLEPLDADTILKVQSAIRWKKPIADVESIVERAKANMARAVISQDPKTGNFCLHIAAQNGHPELVSFLVENKANVNCQNNKGQTPLHMATAYDFYWVARYLLDQGADPKIKNADQHEALVGIDGDKIGAEAWDFPLMILKNCEDDKEQLRFAFDTIEKADPSIFDKALFAQTGMRKKKDCPNNWDQARFVAIMNKL